jgi:flagella basal body P-ring formation protein FlgA
MKKTLRLILIILLAFGAIKVDAQTIHDASVKSIISKQVVEHYKKYTDAQLSAEVVGLPFKDLDLPEGKVTFEVRPTSDKFVPRDLEKVLVYVNGSYIKTFNAPVVIKAYENVLVASCVITREQAVNQKVASIEKKEVSNHLAYALTQKDLSKDIVAKKYFAKGEVIDRRFVKLRPDILRNSEVTVFFSTNGLSISIDGKALSDGAIGDTICIMNKSYNRIYKGTVIGENKVLVKI